jgi:hypothetical protein
MKKLFAILLGLLITTLPCAAYANSSSQTPSSVALADNQSISLCCTSTGCYCYEQTTYLTDVYFHDFNDLAAGKYMPFSKK